MAITRKQAFGKGLSAFLNSSPAVSVAPKPAAAPQTTKTKPAATKKDEFQVEYLLISDVQPNSNQPRKRFNPEKLQELADSIKEHGVLQPVIVCHQPSGDGYVMLAGERRLRAAELARLNVIPAIVVSASDEEMLELALVENLQRDDLNPVEEARAYQTLHEIHGWSQDVISRRVGKQRSTVANTLRLLKLDSPALLDLEHGRLTAGHARALLSLDDEQKRESLRQLILEEGLSVREAERHAQELQHGSLRNLAKPSLNGTGARKNQFSKGLDVHTQALEERLLEYLGCRVKLKVKKNGKGSVEIPFENLDDLDNFFKAIGFQMDH